MYKHIIITAVCLISLQVVAAQHPTAFELLDKYTETQDKLQSFILKFEDKTKSSNSIEKGKENTTYKNGELRSDGDRVRHHSNLWGTWFRRADFLPEDKANYNSLLWDGKTKFQYNKLPESTSSPHGIAFITKSRNDLGIRTIYSRTYPGKTLMGYFWGSDERIDTILRKANKISVRNKTEKVGGSDCFVIDAVTRSGEYAVWIDPVHGYNIAKAEVWRKKGDLIYGDTMGKEDKVLISLKNVRFEKIDGLWVPMEADRNFIRHMIGGNWTKHNRHHKRTEFILNPDHDALGSFVPDDIENGARVHITGVEGINYTWQDRKVVDQDGKVIVDCLKTEKKNTKNTDEKK